MKSFLMIFENQNRVVIKDETLGNSEQQASLYFEQGIR
jgi:hypothetical protein